MTQTSAHGSRQLDCPNTRRRFARIDIDATLLPGLTAEDLKEIGVASLGHRKTIVDAISASREAL